MIARFALLTCFLGGTLCCWSGNALSDERHESLLYAHCEKDAGEYIGHYRGHVLLAREFLAKMGDPEAAIRTSIEHQLRYLWGDYRNDAAAHASMQIALSTEPPEIQIVKRTSQPYGRNLSLAYRERAERLRIDDAYTQAAVARGHIDAAEPALLIDYEIRFRIAACGREVDPPKLAQVLLPPDPWLAYFYVGREHHRPLRYHHDRAVTNPCADDDFADLPHPFYYWYDWLPTRTGPDDDGHAFDCHEWLHPGVDYDEVEVAFAPLHQPTLDFSSLRAQLGEGPITATVLVGVTDHRVVDPKLDRWRARLGAAHSSVLAARAKAALDAAPASIEGGTRSFLELLAALGEVMRIEGHTSRLEDGYLTVEVNGQLLGSQRPLRLRVWLGLTDVFGPVPPRHFAILRRAIVEDEVVIYWGHSGIGENFRLSQIEANAHITHEQMSAELQRSPLRLVAFISCYSYMYFGRDLCARRRRAARQHLLRHDRHRAGGPRSRATRRPPARGRRALERTTGPVPPWWPPCHRRILARDRGRPTQSRSFK